MVPTKACLLLCYQSWIYLIFSVCPCSYYCAHAPITTSAAILTPMDGYGGSPAAAPTPSAGAKSGDFEVDACPVGS